ncbi:substrate-binding domain-containing protein [Actinospica sp.]|uniref:substrate-binding domain-containing protein n=1 Tax=Actinospica sp. TaxID=1872142 RepID=UPI002C6EA741|nr:substrate-binding domain-containing protein [Actinospica sp.]HWG24595.1 substrate-binding domain-containing protein [Actinospica sp.]
MLKMRILSSYFIGGLAVLSVSALLAGCSTGTSGGGGGVSTDAATKTLRIVDIAALINDSFFITGKCGAQAAAKANNATLEFEGPTGNSATDEIKAFAAAAATNPDAMLLAPFSNTGFSTTVSSLMGKGAPVWATGQTLEPADAYGTTITDYFKAAEPLVQIIGQLSGGAGTVGLIADTTGNTTDSDRYTQLVPALEKAYPKLSVLSPQYAQNSTSTAATIAAGLIQAHPDMKVVYASSGPEAVGVAAAIKAAGVGSKVKLVSFDSSPDQITLLKSGQLAATVGQSPYETSYIGTTQVIKYLRSHAGSTSAVPATATVTSTPTMLLTSGNVNSAAAKTYQYMTSCS